MGYFKSLRDFIEHADKKGLLYRYREPIDIATELVPFARVQERGIPDDARKLLLFEHPVDPKGRAYEMPVLSGAYAASDRLLVEGLACGSYHEAVERICYAIEHPIPPVLVEDGPVHEEVHRGAELQEVGLEAIPAPVQEVGFTGVIRFGLPFLTKDPDTGAINLGSYNGFLRSRDRIVIGANRFRVFIREHWRKHLERGEALPCAFIIGPTPALMVASSAAIPYGQASLDEYTFAGGIAGEPVELVRCKTVPLEVPASAEMVVEGYLSNDVLEPDLPFGEFAGYLAAETRLATVMNVTAITHRKNAIFTDVLVGVWPCDTDQIGILIKDAMMYYHLRQKHRLPVKRVHFPGGCGHGQIALIQVEEGTSQTLVNEILERTTDPFLSGTRFCIAVDHDIDITDPENVYWALSFACRPREDMTFRSGITQSHVPTSQPLRSPGVGHSAIEPTRPSDRQVSSRVLINATRKFPFPPVALPEKKYMERALELWNAQDSLPEPKLRWPWYGYHLGYWSEGYEELAELMSKGEWLRVGEIMQQHQKSITPEQVLRLLRSDC
jgi:4-hydroxy-3-polyprenylbenzoate decarboxylase